MWEVHGLVYLGTLLRREVPRGESRGASADDDHIAAAAAGRSGSDLSLLTLTMASS